MLLDLDGVVYRGRSLVPGADKAIEAVRRDGVRVTFITNNASRTPESVADHLRLKAGQAKALKVLTESPWDGGIITEGVKPDTAKADKDGRAFATAAGYIGHTICAEFCTDRKPSGGR